MNVPVLIVYMDFMTNVSDLLLIVCARKICHNFPGIPIVAATGEYQKKTCSVLWRLFSQFQLLDVLCRQWCNFTFLTTCPQGKLGMKINCPE